jgi:hypothetical protein
VTFNNNRINSSFLVALTLILGLTGCVSTGDSSSSEASKEEAKAAAEKDIKAMMAKIPKSSPLSKLELGLSDTRVRKLIGEPDDSTSYQTGKAWIPFYFGTDVSRTDWFYDGEGRVVFSRNRYSGDLKVINVMHVTQTPNP